MGKEQILQAVEEGKRLSITNDVNAVAIYQNGGLNDLLADIKAEAGTLVPDVSNDIGRRKIASWAQKVSRSKTYLDSLGKDLVSGWKTQAKVVDNERKRMRETLDNLKVKVRRPLTEWEETEGRSKDQIKQRIEAIKLNPDVYRSLDWLENFKKSLADLVIDDTFAEYQETAEYVKRSSDLMIDGLISRKKADDLIIAAEKEAKKKALAQERLIYEERVQREADERAEERAKYKIARAQKQAEDAKQVIGRTHPIQHPVDVEAREAAKTEIRVALVGNGINLSVAKKIINLLELGKIPHVTKNF